MSSKFWGEDLLWPIAQPKSCDVDVDAKIERAFKALYEIIPNRDVAEYRYGLVLDIRQLSIYMGMDDRNVWRWWPPSLPKEIVTQEQMDLVLTAIILLLRAVDCHIEDGNASENMRQISSHWHNVLLTSLKYSPEISLVRERLFSGYIFQWKWVT